MWVSKDLYNLFHLKFYLELAYLNIRLIIKVSVETRLALNNS